MIIRILNFLNTGKVVKIYFNLLLTVILQSCVSKIDTQKIESNITSDSVKQDNQAKVFNLGPLLKKSGFYSLNCVDIRENKLKKVSTNRIYVAKIDRCKLLLKVLSDDSCDCSVLRRGDEHYENIIEIAPIAKHIYSVTYKSLRREWYFVNSYKDVEMLFRFDSCTSVR